MLLSYIFFQSLLSLRRRKKRSPMITRAMRSRTPRVTPRAIMSAESKPPGATTETNNVTMNRCPENFEVIMT